MFLLWFILWFIDLFVNVIDDIFVDVVDAVIGGLFDDTFVFVFGVFDNTNNLLFISWLIYVSWLLVLYLYRWLIFPLFLPCFDIFAV